MSKTLRSIFTFILTLFGALVISYFSGKYTLYYNQQVSESRYSGFPIPFYSNQYEGLEIYKGTDAYGGGFSNYLFLLNALIWWIILWFAFTGISLLAENIKNRRHAHIRN